ncbi:MAG: hypothetical protein PHG84_02745 [Endomicrobiaceae bacterium]|nr:hypothetical protein [Endomicrobiaceae bacterium]MDD3053308.1 hypothetical protein [Endomicrobiaceae bacterium]
MFLTTVYEYFDAVKILSFASKILKGININIKDKATPICIEVFNNIEVPSSSVVETSDVIKNITLGVINNNTDAITRRKNNIKLSIFKFPGLNSVVFDKKNIKKINKKIDKKGIVINSSSIDNKIKEIMIK